VGGDWVATAAAAWAGQRRPARVRCRACGREEEYSTEAPASCPVCGAGEREVTGGHELEVSGVELVGQEQEP
jgi:Zn finger protein HypA/HybF involved in hydrogenase expression